MKTKIEWTDKAWSPITGCTPVSEGCAYCWAKTFANRLKGRCGYPKENPFKPGLIHSDRWNEPYKTRKYSKIAVCLMGDLFHEDVKDYDIQKVLNICLDNPFHIFQILSKRVQRMTKMVFPEQLLGRHFCWKSETCWWKTSASGNNSGNPLCQFRTIAWICRFNCSSF